VLGRASRDLLQSV